MTDFTRDPSTHPANDPLTEERLTRVRDELQRKLEYGRDHFFADAAKAIDELLALRKMKQEAINTHDSIIAEQLAHVLSGMEGTEHQRAVIICAVDRLNHNAEMLQKAPAAPAAQEAILYEPSPTDSVNAPLKFTDVEDRAWVVGAEWMRDAFKRENPHLRIANDDDPVPQLPQPAVMTPDYSRFLSDVMTAAGLLSHGKRDKALATSLSEFCVAERMRMDAPCRAAPLQGAEPVSQPYTLRDGWVAVPVEPTEEMNKAGWAAMNEHDAIDPTYRAMLAAAPRLTGSEPVSVPGKWIPCSERMPETMVSVLATGDWFDYAVTAWSGKEWLDFDDYEPPVTHWMPLPAAPQQEAE